jgi:hypothetical protein
MKKLQRLVLAISVFFALCFTVLHHGWANYDQNKVLDYTGVIKESKYESPHALIKVKDKKKTWLVYLAPPSRMESRGVPLDGLEKGKSIRVVGYPHKEIKDEMRAERIFINGAKYELR